MESDIKTPTLMADHKDLELSIRKEKVKAYHEKVEKNISRLVIFDQWVELLDGIEDFSHILVLYWPHLINPERRKLRKVHPMGRKDMPLQGIFATCSPARPNPVLVSAVPLIERKGNTLKVKGFEAVDGSPLIDIKPYVKPYYGAENPTVPQWMARLHQELDIDIF
ncbi:MAG: tRNA (N6-threonylcarbamoyladenosine(37)-N6)-methyltransferase TrmO [Desulfobacteraceae bacterium]